MRRSSRGSATLLPQCPPERSPRRSEWHRESAVWEGVLRRRQLNGVSNTSASGARTEEWPTNHTDAQLQHNYTLAPWLGSGHLNGIWPLEAPADAAVRCEKFLSRNWLPTGKLHLTGGVPLEGFNTYPFVVSGKADARLQRFQTLKIEPSAFDRAMQYIPGFRDLVHAAAAAIAEKHVIDVSRLELGSAHALVQAGDSDSSTAFAMHRDTEDDPNTVYTSITLLTPTPDGTPPSQMGIAGGTPFSYGTNAGSGCYFLADFYHASGPSVANASLLKVAMFWYVNPPQAVLVKPKKTRRSAK